MTTAVEIFDNRGKQLQLAGLVVLTCLVAFISAYETEGLLAIGAACAIFLLALLGPRSALIFLAACAVVAGSIGTDSGQFAAYSRGAALYGKFALFAGVAGLNVLRGAAVPARQPFTKWFTVTLFALLVLQTASVVWSWSPIDGFQEAVAFATLLLAVLTTVLYAWNDRDTVRKDLETLAAVLALTLGLCVVLFVVAPPWAFNLDAFGPFGRGRLRGILQNPNTIGIAASVGLPLTFALAMFHRGLRRATWAIASSAICVALLLSQSRGGILAAAVGVAVVLFRRPPMSRRARLLIAAGVLVVVIPMVTAVGILVARRAEAIGQTGGRTDAWVLALEAYSDRPVLGFGYGVGELAFAPYVLAVDTSQCATHCFQGSSTHNAYLQVLLELGPVGVAVALVPLTIALSAAFRSEKSILTAGVCGVLAAGLTSQVFESGFTSPGSIIAFNLWMIAGAAVRLRDLE